MRLPVTVPPGLLAGAHRVPPTLTEAFISIPPSAIWMKTKSQNHVVRRSEEHTSVQSHVNLVCRLLLEKKKGQLTTVRCSLPVKDTQVEPASWSPRAPTDEYLLVRQSLAVQGSRHHDDDVDAGLCLWIVR